jgi:hypothetical protein
MGLLVLAIAAAAIRLDKENDFDSANFPDGMRSQGDGPPATC